MCGESTCYCGAFGLASVCKLTFHGDCDAIIVAEEAVFVGRMLQISERLLAVNTAGMHFGMYWKSSWDQDSASQCCGQSPARCVLIHRGLIDIVIIIIVFCTYCLLPRIALFYPRPQHHHL